MIYVSVLAGFVLLLAGGEVLVRGGVALARHLGVSPLLVGLTVVAFGTSAPELVICLIAALEGAPAIAVGNVVGSNIANILLIVGVSALIYPIAVSRRSIKRDGTVVVISALLFSLLAMTGVLGFWHGLVMVISLLLYLAYSYVSDKRDSEAAAAIEREIEEMGPAAEPVWKSLMLLGFGLGAVIWGSDLLVDGAVAAARDFGISEAVIGLTLIAIGTSLPELATGVVAAYRKHSDLAFGNVVGSNIFNTIGVMGVVAVATPVEVPSQIVHFDLWVMLGVTLAFMGGAYLLRRVGRLTALVYLLGYGAYVAAQFLGMSGLQAHTG